MNPKQRNIPADLCQRGDDGFPVGAESVMRKAWGKIPDATEFQKGLRLEVPAEVHGWSWSTTFGRWSAYVTFADGWEGYTYPKHRSVAAGR